MLLAIPSWSKGPVQPEVRRVGDLWGILSDGEVVVVTAAATTVVDGMAA